MGPLTSPIRTHTHPLPRRRPSYPAIRPHAVSSGRRGFFLIPAKKNTAHARTAPGRPPLSSKHARPRVQLRLGCRVRRHAGPGYTVRPTRHMLSSGKWVATSDRRRVGGRCRWCHGHALTRTSTSTSKRHTPRRPHFSPASSPSLSLSCR